LPQSGLTAYLTGPNAANVSFTNLIGERLPLLIGVVVALSLGLLLVVFRSVVIAVKAALMNLLSVCAAYGVLTAVTQWGWLGHVFGLPEKMPVTTWVPAARLAGPAAAGQAGRGSQRKRAPSRDIGCGALRGRKPAAVPHLYRAGQRLVT
jgi:uncharacterized membrane protein YdfJ with MMPL/SSD domain